MDLICYLTLMFSAAGFFFLLKYTLLENQLDMKSDRIPKETRCVFLKWFLIQTL